MNNRGEKTILELVTVEKKLNCTTNILELVNVPNVVGGITSGDRS